MSQYVPKPDPRIESASRGTAKVILVTCAMPALGFLLFGVLLHVAPPSAEFLAISATSFICFAVVARAMLRRCVHLRILRDEAERSAFSWDVTFIISVLASLTFLSAIRQLPPTLEALALVPGGLLGSIIGWSVAQRAWPSETARLHQLERMKRGRGW